MADQDQSHESAILGSLYKRTQQQMLSAWGGTTDKYTKGERAEMMEGGRSAATGLERQARLLNEANASLEGIEQGGRYDSESSFAAAAERGIQKKMKALGMLEDASDDIQYDPMVAEFVDPLTGERIDAESFDFASDRALQEAMSQDLKNASYTNDADLRALEDIARTQAGDDHWRGKSQVTEQSKAQFDQVFGENSQTMQDAWSSGRLNMREVTNQLSQVRNAANAAGRGMLKAGTEDEYAQRQANALAQADSYNTAQSFAQQKGEAQIAETADAKAGLRESIQEDKQNLARRSAGRTGSGTRKTRIDYGGDSSGSRPV